MRTYVTGAIFLSLLMAGLAFSQNAQLGGIVTDPSGGLVPGVTVTATIRRRAVVSSTITNESGAYTFQACTRESYKVSAGLPGFQTQTVSGSRTSIVCTQNFQLQVSTALTTVEVSADSTLAISTNSATVGDVLPKRR
jgi:hypothetical protein